MIKLLNKLHDADLKTRILIFYLFAMVMSMLSFFLFHDSSIVMGVTVLLVIHILEPDKSKNNDKLVYIVGATLAIISLIIIEQLATGTSELSQLLSLFQI